MIYRRFRAPTPNLKTHARSAVDGVPGKRRMESGAPTHFTSAVKQADCGRGRLPGGPLAKSLSQGVPYPRPFKPPEPPAAPAFSPSPSWFDNSFLLQVTSWAPEGKLSRLEPLAQQESASEDAEAEWRRSHACLLYTSPSPRD